MSSCSSTLHAQIGTDTLSLPGGGSHSLPGASSHTLNGASRVVSQLSQEDEQLLEAAQVKINLLHQINYGDLRKAFFHFVKLIITDPKCIIMNTTTVFM